AAHQVSPLPLPTLFRSPGPGHSLGQAHVRLPHPQEEEVQRVHRARAAAGLTDRGRRCKMGRSLKKGPYAHPSLLKKIRAMNESRSEEHTSELQSREKLV